MPPTAARIDAAAQQADECLRQIAGLPRETWVTIVDDRPLSRLRLRRLAHRSGLVIERELVVLPARGSRVAVVEDVAGATPTGAAVVAPPWLGRTLPWSWARWLASDRVLLARRA